MLPTAISSPAARLLVLAIVVALAIAASQLAITTAGGPVQGIFERGTLDFEVEEPTSLAIGPDGRLYVGAITGIYALTLDPQTQNVLDIEEISGDARFVLGLTFDHTAPPGAPVKLYASRQDFTGVDGYWGRVTTYTAPNWEAEDIIVNLPSSLPLLNHMTNALAFHDDGRLFIAQGSNTDTGVVGQPPMFYPETPLSAAILVADVNAPGFDGMLVYDPPGEPLDHDVDLISGDVEVFSAGHRNSYGMAFHSNGYLYATDNGPSGHASSADCDGGTVFTSTFDELNLVEEGNYYGFPNLNRGRFDPRECTYHPPDEPSTNGYTAPIAPMVRHCSCNSVIEYQGPASGGEFNGHLIIARFGRSDLWRVELSADGRSIESESALARNYDSPLGLALAPNGTIYITEFGDAKISYLSPLPPDPTPTSDQPATATNTPAVAPTLTPTPEGLPGDANCSGATDSIDAALVLQFVAGLIPSVPCPHLADVNGDGNLTAVDAALILQISAGLL